MISSHRNYRVPGKKLAPTCGHNASTGLTVKEYKVLAALEFKSCLQELAPYEVAVRRCKKRLSTRRSKVVEVFAEITHYSKLPNNKFGHAQKRYLKRLIVQDMLEHIDAVDQFLLDCAE